jgi:hypothetical protein
MQYAAAALSHVNCMTGAAEQKHARNCTVQHDSWQCRTKATQTGLTYAFVISAKCITLCVICIKWLESSRWLARFVLRERQGGHALEARRTMHILRAHTLPGHVAPREVIWASRRLDLLEQRRLKHALRVGFVLPSGECGELCCDGAVDGAVGVQEGPVNVLSPMHAALVPEGMEQH